MAAAGGGRRAVTFDRLIRDYACTPAERDELAWFLALYRARQTWEALRSRDLEEPVATTTSRLGEPQSAPRQTRGGEKE
jgi:hypothetical protein